MYQLSCQASQESISKVDTFGVRIYTLFVAILQRIITLSSPRIFPCSVLASLRTCRAWVCPSNDSRC